MGGDIWGGQAGVCGCGGEDADEVKVLKRKEKTTKGRKRKGEEGEEGVEPGSSVSRFRHYMGAVSGWQCSDGGKAWNPGAVFLGSDTAWEQCRGGSVVMKREAV